MTRRLASLLRLTLLAASVLVTGHAFADVAPPSDAGTVVDMANNMAKPDMSAPAGEDDDGCSMTGRRTSSKASAIVLGIGALGLAFSRRRRLS